jgi:hypothetical protein
MIAACALHYKGNHNAIPTTRNYSYKMNVIVLRFEILLVLEGIM